MLKEVKERVYTPTMSYSVRRGDPELVGPASGTPPETKALSDMDNMDLLRTHVSYALIYRGGQDGVHPAAVIRRALGQALVHYYPLAGRLREVEEGRELVVDCTGEGVLFVQADADVPLADLESAGLAPPLPCWDQLLFDVQGSRGMLNSPLLLIQVTRLLCGGFVFAMRFNHTICDGIGIAQFVSAVGELARGLTSMTVTPVWSREIIKARNPPLESSSPQQELSIFPPPPAGDIVTRSFTFCARDIAAIKKSLPHHLRVTATTFEALAAFIWRARTAALELPATEDATLDIAVNIRGADKMNLPAGYYGNAVVSSLAVVNALALRRGSLGDAVELVRLAKAAVTTQYVRSVVDGRRFYAFVPANIFMISDARKIGLDRVDFGWGKPVFAGPPDFYFGLGMFIPVKDRDGAEAVVVPVVLPQPAMELFAAEVDRLRVDASDM